MFQRSVKGKKYSKLVTGDGHERYIITLGAHAQRGYGSWYIRVCTVCLLRLTFPMFVCLTNDTTYLTGNEGQKFRAVLSENAPLQSWSGSSIVRLMRSRPFLSLRKMRMRMVLGLSCVSVRSVCPEP